jgi:anti-anti-sigma factor
VTQDAQPSLGPPQSGVELLRTRVAMLDLRPPRARLTFGVSAKDETLYLQIVGELDLATGPELASHLSAWIRDGDAISLDLARVTFIDLSGLHVLLDARRDAEARGQRLHIAVPGHACARLLELTRTTHLLRAV